MTSSAPTLSSVSTLALFTVASLAAMIALVAFPVALITLTTTGFLLMILSRDYAPRTYSWDRIHADTPVASTAPQRFCLAA